VGAPVCASDRDPILQPASEWYSRPMNRHETTHRLRLQRIAERAMAQRGFLAQFSSEVLGELAIIERDPPDPSPQVRDLRSMLWASIDNDDSRDLDQLSVAQPLDGGSTRVLVAIADVDLLVRKGTAIDDHARVNTTSVYTAARIFSMLPERLSTDLTSLNDGEDRMSIVIEMVVDPQGNVSASDVYPAVVHNHAKLTYNAVGAWLEGEGELPAVVAGVNGLEENLRLQDDAAQRLKRSRHEHGALDLQTIEARAVFDGDAIADLAADEKNRAKELIEDFMIAANGVTARFLESRGFPSLRRVVRSPDRWARIVDLAADMGERLPEDPDAQALGRFLVRRRKADSLRFPDLSLAVVKLMGRGEYAVEFPGESATGHFGLAVRDYTHSTAPNRRFPDLVTQRMVKAALAGQAVPYGDAELVAIARHCTEKENDAEKVERQVSKSAAALLLESRIGERFEGVVSGASPKGTWVRVFSPPVEGRIEQGANGLDVGDRVRVQLIHTDVEEGFIDFRRTNH
jgi:VacB/RNase II family 3'-5' exoribonuclease